MFKVLLIVIAGLALPYNLLLGFGYTSEGAVIGTFSLWALLAILYMANQFGALGALAGSRGSDEEEVDDGQRLL